LSRISFLPVLLVLIVIPVASCTDVSLSVSESIPPTFRFHKAYWSEVNSFPFFVVEEVAVENEGRSHSQQVREKNLIVWKIIPKPELWGTGILDHLPPITYGKVPDGFRQELPKEAPALVLEEGRVYEASGAPTLMPDAIVRFRIDNGKVKTLSSSGSR